LPREIKAVVDGEPSLAMTMLAAPMSHPQGPLVSVGKLALPPHLAKDDEVLCCEGDADRLRMAWERSPVNLTGLTYQAQNHFDIAGAPAYAAHFA
jgi:hypothetical protein